MAESRNKAVYRRFVEEVINKGNTSIIPELYHPDYVDHSAPPGADHSGSVFEQVAAIPKLFRSAFPDVHFTIDFMVEEGEWVATHVTGRAQHIGGPFAGVEPSGWKVTWTSEGMFRMKDGKIAEHYGAPDIFGLRMQVTRVPEKGSLDEARAIVTRYVYHVNKQDYDDFDKYVVEDYVDHDPIPGQQPGREGLKNAYRGFSDAFPDIWFTFEDLIAEGDLVIGRGVIEGTNKAPFLMLPATNKKVKWTGTRMFRVRDGKVSEGWINFDMLAVLQQLGMMGPQGDAPAAESQPQQAQDPKVDKNIDLVKRYFETIWNRGELQRESEFVARDIIVHQSSVPGLPGATGTLEIVAMLRAAIPDLHVEHTVIFGEGDKVVHHWEAKGHHTGAPLLGAPSANKQLTVTGINEYRIANGLIAERWGQMDVASLRQQLGLPPS